ncbi:MULTISPECIES: SDR family NAD(P)-dependent oxidoreductase [unclassified Nocardioides]|uniref:SDR family NAD(P)-dependent oxidoreductase n=1 Tax=unclassified Nocardioides TaxID=2615069 RepID=UPI0006FB6060|nr:MULTISPECIES: SDR family oxidoreductase [unclassified Nocardioides]KRA31336.1 short-chain dehydrogenase [Nocardioides sp. Root614]KRA87957.1 short-chain dehydrogenase [Nocardioides sp. Root682]
MSAPDLTGQTAIVTGGGSGIGAALTRALVAAGAHVVCADVDLAGAESVAATAVGLGSATARRVDVTSVDDVQGAVDAVVAQHGRLDLMFNNAGITFLGNTEDLTLAQWNAIIDVNIRGVVHGVHAAYPQMIKQGSGHIVNTASMGGLMAAGLMTSYVTTKHAVVGLSLALRTEAAAYGVGVTAVCPAAVDTPILDKGEFGAFRGRDFYLEGQGIKNPVDPDLLALRVLEAVAGNRALVIEPRQARMAWRVGRLAPVFVNKAATKFIAKQRALSSAGLGR